MAKAKVVFKQEDETILNSEPIGPVTVNGVTKKDWVSLTEAQAMAKKLGVDLVVE